MGNGEVDHHGVVWIMLNLLAQSTLWLLVVLSGVEHDLNGYGYS